MREWRDIAAHHPEVKPLFMQVMPDHVHFILQVLRPMAKPLGNVIGGFKAGSSKAAIGRPGLWAEGFQDTILFHEGQLDAMFRYLRDNPRRLAVKRLCPDLFKVRRKLELPSVGYCSAIARPLATIFFSTNRTSCRCNVRARFSPMREQPSLEEAGR